MTYQEMDLQSQCAAIAMGVSAKSMDGRLQVLAYFLNIDKTNIFEPSLQSAFQHLAIIHVTLLRL